MRKFKFETISEKYLSDTITPVSLYLKIRDKFANSLLLESSDYHTKENSFSFLCVEPMLTIKAEEENVSFSYYNEILEEKIIENNFSEVFEVFKRNIEIEQTKKTENFNGFYGYMTFESVQYFEKLKFTNPKPSSEIPTLQFSFFRFIIAINHFKNELYILENKPKNENSRIEEIKKYLVSSSLTNYSFQTVGEESSNCTNEEFKNYVTNAKAHCQRGDVFQMVVSRQFKQDFSGDDFNVYRALRSINPSPYLFYFDYGSFKLMGSSPEAQLKIKDKKAIMHPIAGTFKRTGNDEEDRKLAVQLSEDEKENAEHVMLVDLARNDLSRHASNVNVEVFKEIQFFSHVIHLVSSVEGKLKDDSIQMIGGTFPAGTLSGAPKYKAMELINKYENQQRGFYGGGIGFIGLNDDVNLAIAIRSFVSKNNSLYYQAGAGVVIHSEEEKELQEVNHKLAALKKALHLAETI
ncbi:anthranilate synthase component I family protein [Aureivirga sp. CE67]|uniref:anthranilate synthase component I family protein n=1 Tax=Aureivirga sp. CE67 TaxID=1788983 RepID=UPI0018C9F7FC|nr:chorismate-binding protein [Aureivirga sp. CE67]